MIRRVRSSALAWRAAASICSWLLLASTPGYAQSPDPNADPAAPAPPAADSTYTDTLDAAEADGDVPRRRLISWNEYEGPYFITARRAAASSTTTPVTRRTTTARRRADWSDKADLRDFRFMLKGKLKFVPRLSYTIGYMYDKAQDDWRFRQTGIMVDVPELLGQHLRRPHQGRLLDQQDHGRLPGLDERESRDQRRASAHPGRRHQVDAATFPSGKFVYNLGWFGDSRSENESFNKNDNQFAARAVWLPFTGTTRASLHLALAGALRGRERRLPAVPLQAGILSGAILRDRYRQVPRRACDHDGHRSLLPARTSDVRHGVFLQPGLLGPEERSVLSRRRSLRRLPSDRRNHALQPARRVLRAHLAARDRLRRWPGRVGVGAANSYADLDSKPSTAASSGASRPWSTGTSPTTCVSNGLPATAFSTASA